MFPGRFQAKALVKGVPGLFMVESVDSKKCASSLDKACEAAGRGPLGVMVQVPPIFYEQAFNFKRSCH